MSGKKSAYRERTFFEKSWPFRVSGKTKTEILPPDNYEWPFDCILEGSLPESVEGLKDAWVIYRLKAEIGRRRAKDIVVRKPLRLVRTLDPSALELAHAMVSSRGPANDVSPNVFPERGEHLAEQGRVLYQYSQQGHHLWLIRPR
jgi:hypothetical protein